MKLHLYSIVLISAVLFSVQSSAQAWLWAKQPVFTGHPTDQSDGEGYAVATDNSGNVYQTGFFAYATMQYGATFLNSVNPTAFLSKYDANGNLLWAHQGVVATLYDESVSNAVAVDASGNVYITGFFMDSVTFGNITLVSNPGQQQEDYLEVFLVKYDPNGVVQWAEQSTTTKFNGYPNQGLGVACDHAGNIYITGEFGNTMTFGTASITTPSGGAGDVFLVKYDTNGNVIWAEAGNMPSSTSSSKGNAVTVDAFDNVYITGSFHDSISFGSQLLVNTSVVGDIFVAKFTSDAVPVWAKQTTNSSTDFWENGPISGNGLTTDRAGNVYLAGNFEDTIYFGPIELTNPINFANYGFPYGDMLIAKYDPNGNVVWAQAGQPFVNASYAGWSIASDTLNHLYYLGSAANFYSGAQLNYVVKFGADTFSTGNTPPSWEGSFVIEFDTSGNVLCGNAMPMGGDDQGGIATDPSGKYVFMGQDYNCQFTVYIAGDTINYPAVTGEEVPFIARWSACTKVSLGLSTSQVNVSCHGLCDGQATANPAGGFPPYKYSWGTPHSDTTKTVTGLCAGSYTIIVTDSAGTSDSSVVTITQPAGFTISAAPADTSICSGDSVILKATIFGAGGQYNFAWSPSSGLNDTTTSQVVASPSDSTVYSVIATNSGNCTASASVSVNVNAGLPVSITIAVSPSDTICAGTPVTFTAKPVNGGNPSYQWTLDNHDAGTNSMAYSTDSLSNGDQVACIVTSSIKCATGSPATSNTIPITIVPAEMAVLTSNKDTICAGSTAQLSVTGNTTNLLWQSSLNGNNYTSIAGVDTSVYPASPQQTTYYRVIAGSGECIDTSTAFMLVVKTSLPPPGITTADTIICSGDSTQVCASGIFTGYLWNTGDTGSCIEANSAGAYWVTATGTNDCAVISNHVEISVYPVPSVSITVKGDTLTSFGAVTYQWYLNDSVIKGATSTQIIAKTPGSYAVMITDSNGCGELSNAVTITGITNLEEENIRVFPNPSTGSWQLIAGTEWIGSQLIIYSADGRIIFRSIIQNTSSWISFEAPAGVYLVQISSPAASVTYKLIRL